MSSKLSQSNEIDLTLASQRSMHVRRLYNQLEEQILGRVWTVEEDMLGFFTDVGVVGRLVMAAEGPWGYSGDVDAELRSKLPECLWWILVLSHRLGIDITDSFTTFINKLHDELTGSTSRVSSSSTHGIELSGIDEREDE